MIETGVKVRCIKGFAVKPTDPFNLENLKLPTVGEIYTVRGVVICACGAPGLHLEEVTNRKFAYQVGGMREPSWALRNFEVVP